MQNKYLRIILSKPYDIPIKILHQLANNKKLYTQLNYKRLPSNPRKSNQDHWRLSNRQNPTENKDKTSNVCNTQ